MSAPDWSCGSERNRPAPARPGARLAARAGPRRRRRPLFCAALHPALTRDDDRPAPDADPRAAAPGGQVIPAPAREGWPAELLTVLRLAFPASPE